jgi:serine/threonine protein phosphatase PrpC
MFAVYDGHGDQGRICASYVRKTLPQLLGKHIRQARVRKYRAQLEATGETKGKKLFEPANWPYLSQQEYRVCCRKAFLECDQKIHDDKTVRTTR